MPLGYQSNFVHSEKKALWTKADANVFDHACNVSLQIGNVEISIEGPCVAFAVSPLFAWRDVA